MHCPPIKTQPLLGRAIFAFSLFLAFLLLGGCVQLDKMPFNEVVSGNSDSSLTATPEAGSLAPSLTAISPSEKPLRNTVTTVAATTTNATDATNATDTTVTTLAAVAPALVETFPPASNQTTPSVAEVSVMNLPGDPQVTVFPRYSAARVTDLTPPIAKPQQTPEAPAPVHTPSLLSTIKPPPVDLWERIRGGFKMNQGEGNPLVHNWENYYTNRPDYFARMIENSRPFLFYIVNELERRGMPSEIALLPMIESAYNPIAYSHAQASGIWQFIASTGKSYGLKQNTWYDGRRDIQAATNAALDYLQNLYGLFGDWELALASYNWGEKAVQRAMDKNLAKGMPTNYLSLTMPAETRNYIPKLIAVKNIIADPQRFGINFASIPNESLIASLTLKRHIDVAVAAKFAGMTKEAFRFLNPANNRPVINADMSETILLPKERVEKFMAHMNDNANKPLISIKTHTVNSGEKLESIANDHHISVIQLKQMNNITPRQRIITGQTILVPAGNELEPELKELSPPSFIPVVKKIQHAAKQKSTSKKHLARQDHHRDTHAQPVAVHKKRVTQQKPNTTKTSSIGLALR